MLAYTNTLLLVCANCAYQPHGLFIVGLA
jgi:hypothetical protein